MKRIIGYCIAFLLLTAEVCGKQVKSDLSVLYVGGSPEIETMIHNPLFWKKVSANVRLHSKNY